MFLCLKDSRILFSDFKLTTLLIFFPAVNITCGIKIKYSNWRDPWEPDHPHPTSIESKHSDKNRKWKKIASEIRVAYIFGIHKKLNRGKIPINNGNHDREICVHFI